MSLQLGTWKADFRIVLHSQHRLREELKQRIWGWGLESRMHLLVYRHRADGSRPGLIPGWGRVLMEIDGQYSRTRSKDIASLCQTFRRYWLLTVDLNFSLARDIVQFQWVPLNKKNNIILSASLEGQTKPQSSYPELGRFLFMNIVIYQFCNG